MKKTTLLKKLILDRDVLVMPGVHDVLSAKIAEKVGAKAVQVSGYGLSACYLGLPDMGILTLTQMAEITRNICRAVDIPVMADGDTGFGNAINLYYAVKEFEAAGAAGINLEDQLFPKRCGHMQGKQIISLDEGVKKIQAAVDAKTDPDFVINARTDAIAVYGVDEAIKRGNAYAKAGADLIFVEAPTGEEDIKRVIQSIDAPVSINMLYGKKTPPISVEQIASYGAARVSVPIASVMATAYALEKLYKHILEKGEITTIQDVSYAFDHFTDLLGMQHILELERQFLHSEELDARYHCK